MLGGVDIGIVMASDAESATPMSSVRTPPTESSCGPIATPTEQRIGTSNAAVAELEMKFDSNQQSKPELTSTRAGDQLANGMACTRCCAKPDFWKPRPRAKPPATIKSTLQLTFSSSLTPITPVTVRMAIGIMKDDYDTLHGYAFSLQNDMPIISNTSHEGTLPLKAQILSCKGANTTTVKCARDEKSITVRVYNPKTEVSNALLCFCKKVRDAKITDSAEYGDKRADFTDNKVELRIDPGELKTVTVEF